MTEIVSLSERARRIRESDLRMIYAAGLGHVGSDFSAIDVLTALYFDTLRIDPDAPEDPDRDRFVLSKGHSAGALYVTLAEAGFIPHELLETFAQPESTLNGHPNRLKVPGVEASTGPLGHGLPVAVGMAIAAKLRGASWRTFALCGDGELQEGSMWEAAMAASQFELDHLTLIVDRNGLQQGAPTEVTMRLDPLAERFASFGWMVHEVDGHDHPALAAAFAATPYADGRPNCVIARTEKGHGVSFMTDNVAWHHRVPTADEYEIALHELGATA
ncbi:MAG: transketolase [Ilumatobacteraceae bacterium]|nr:transketolase [Ilumatobacteraceae bacterium]